MKVGEKLALARKYHTPAFTQEELAQALGVDTSTVGRWESRDHVPSEKLPRVAMVLDVREDWFYDGSDLTPDKARRVAVEEPPNIRTVGPEEFGRAGSLIKEGQFVALPVWRGVSAGSVEECAFFESDEPEFREVPYFLTLGQPERHVLCIASGMSMTPRIDHSDRALIRLDPDVPPGHIIVATSTDAKTYIKKLMKGDDRRLELHSLNEAFIPILGLDGWILRGGVTAILHAYEGGKPNIEWDEGRYLRA